MAIKKKTVEKLIGLIKKDIDKLLIEKTSLEIVLENLNNQLINLQESYQRELNYTIANHIVNFDSSNFIFNEINKQNRKKNEINEVIDNLNHLLNDIMNKNVERKKYEHLLSQILENEKILEEKNEMRIIDEFAMLNSKEHNS